jgi:hypothetical protein
LRYEIPVEILILEKVAPNPTTIFTFAFGGVVNHLELRAVSPQQQLFTAMKDQSGASPVGGTPDIKNNIQMVLVNNPAPGDWIVQVLGTEVNIGNPVQGYALVVTANMPVCDNDPMSLKQFDSDSGVNVPFSVRSNLLPAMGINASATISLRRLMCTVND